MNNDLISREALKETINSSIAEATKIGIMVDADYLWALLNYAIDNAPTVERPQGEWECARIGNKNYIVCSHCKERFETENTLELWQSEYRFCHRCGANMKKEAE